ncbi:MAG: FG-GAP repeat domain-containing protein [Sandaracinaceae bacterium]
MLPARALVCFSALTLVGCAGAPEPVRFEDWLRVGVETEDEAEAVERQLTSGGFTRTTRLHSPRFIALAFTRADGRRAVRVVTSRGVVASLDSHEPDGVRERHGPVRLLELDDVIDHDLDGDGAPEVVVARDEAGRVCHAVLRIDEEGRALAVADDAAELTPGGCVTGFSDVDGDGAFEALAGLSWPQLALDGVPQVDAVLVADEGGFRARGAPAVHQTRERESRERALQVAHTRLNVADALRLGVELAALAHLDGAALDAQVGRFDRAMQGLVLTRGQLVAVRRARRWIAAGWRPDHTRDTPAVRSDGQEEEAGR